MALIESYNNDPAASSGACLADSLFHYKMSDSLAEDRRVALITGASGGIGRAIASELAGMGLCLMLAGRSREKLDDCGAFLSRSGIRVEAAVVDLEEDGAPKRLVEETMKAFGSLDVLVNNAGMFHLAEIEHTEEKALRRVMQVNTIAPFLLCKYAIPHLRKSERASIINICSSAARKGHKNEGAYVASKHALYGLTKTLTSELAKDKIRVHALLPGGVDTEMALTAGAHLDRSTFISPQEVAEVTAFLIRFGKKGLIDEIDLRRSGFG